MKKRDANIEVMRCAMMFCIVLLHCCQFGPSSGTVFAKGLKGLLYCGVDAFVFISGWYGIRFGWQKILQLLGCGLFASSVVCAFSPLVGNGLSFKYSLGWFGNAYVALMCLAPLVNAGLETLRERGLLISAWCTYAVAMVVDWLPLGGGVDLHVPGWTGLSFNVLLFVYVTGRVLRWQDWSGRIRFWQALSVCGTLALLNVVWGYAAGQAGASGVLHQIFVGTRDNDSPLTIAFAVSVFLVFKTMKFPRSVNALCCAIAPSMFSVYLLHLGANMAVSIALWNKYIFGLCGNLLCAAALIFSICVLLDVVRRTLFRMSRSRKMSS